MARKQLYHPAIVPVVTSLPASPVDGQIIYYLADAGAGIIWTLRYRAASPSAYKWEFVGGSPLVARRSAASSFDLTSGWENPDTGDGGPSISLPLSGDYLVRLLIGQVTSSATDAAVRATLAATGFAAGTATAEWRSHGTSNNGVGSLVIEDDLVGISGTLNTLYQVSSATGTVQQRMLTAKPIRVG